MGSERVHHRVRGRRVKALGMNGAMAKVAVALAALAAWSGMAREAWERGSIALLDGVPWVFTVQDDGTASIQGGHACGDVVVPASIGCYPVTSISRRAFFNCSGMTSVAVPAGVGRIGDSAFEGCSGLSSVTLPDGVTDIGWYAFRNCTGLSSVTMPDSVTNLAGYVLEGCSSLTAVTLPRGVEALPAGLFRRCTGLASVSIPDSVKDIQVTAFYGCSGLASVVVPNGVTNIGHGAFAACTGLASAMIPDSVLCLDGAFYGCTGLKTLHVPASWAGTRMPETAGIPEDCTIMFGDAPPPETAGTP